MSDWLASLELTDVFFDKLAAEVEAERRGEEPHKINVEPEGPLYRELSVGIDVRYGVRVRLIDESGDSIAYLESQVLMSFRSDDEGAAGSAEVEEFVEGTGVRVAFPYLREAVQFLAWRCGIPEILFGLVNDSALSPRRVKFGPDVFESAIGAPDRDD